MKFKVLIITICLGLTGCSSSSLHSVCSFGNVVTEIESYKDTVAVNKVVIDSSPLFARAFCKSFENAGVECSYINDVVSPLKKITPHEMKQKLKDQNFDVYLSLQGGNDSVLRSYGGSMSTFQASVSGNQINGNSQTTSLMYTSRGLSIEINGYNVKTENKVYLAQTHTSGSGTACVGNGVYSISLAQAVAKDFLGAP